MAEYLLGGPPAEGRLGILPAAFNPLTIAHLGLADAAADLFGLVQVAFLLPARFPHKEFEQTSFRDRVEMLVGSLGGRGERAAATSRGGLFIEIAREFRELCRPGVELFLLCGRDAAERIVSWDYGEGPSIARQLEEFQLAVASRSGDYAVPPELAGRIHTLRLPEGLESVSASAVRKAVRGGGEWEAMVPAGAAEVIRKKRLYGSR